MIKFEQIIEDEIKEQIESINYIKNELKFLKEEFPILKIKYEYDEKVRTHFIEILPEVEFNNNKNYIEWECKMFDKFIKLYPNMNICFFSENSTVDIKNNILEEK